MNDKQLGAAPKPPAETEQASGWFTRLRAQPGFRTAAVAFVLTVILGVGGPAAYAYWSASTSVMISGSTARAVLPALTGDVQCSQPYGVGVVRIVYPRVASLPADANVVATVSVPGGNPRLYAIPNDGMFVLKDLPGLTGSLSWGDRMTISVTTAYLENVPASLPAAVEDAKVLDTAATAPKPTNASYLASYFC